MARPITLITGASAGIGAEFARLCAERGEELVLVARRRDRLQALAAELGGRANVVAMDLAEAQGPERLVRELESSGFEIGTLINNAGFGLSGRFAELPRQRQEEMIGLNITTLTSLAHLVLPGMLARGRGAILNVASTAAFQPGPGMAVYFATKAYVLSLSEALHQEVKGTGVKVSALCPGPTATEFGDVAGIREDVTQKVFKADARKVAEAGLKGLDVNQAVVIPGVANKVTAHGVRFFPRALVRRVVAAIKF